MNSIAEKIYRLIRERSLGTDLSSLKQRGVKRVSVFKSNQLGDLVAMAVEQVLRDYGIKLSQGDMEGLSEEGRQAFLNMMKERDAYKEIAEDLQKEQQSLEIHRDVLESQIEREGSFLEDERGFWTEIPIGEDELGYRDRLQQVLRHTLDKRVSTLGPDADDRLVKFLEEMVEGLGRDLDDVFGTTLEEIRARYAEEGERRIETLERRVQKMRESLASAEDALSRAEASGPEETGVASIYRSAQGLRTDDGAYEKKKSMLEEIFRLNKDIKEQIR